ncbi:MAG: hypothetical protein KGZ79_06265 [Dethiobacter sp.]|jgi:hypothetical protein|nr:hypothetical protein [Dethiobacter sp.]
MDRLTAGSVAGLASGIVVGTISQILHALGICRMCLVSIGGGMFLREMLGATAPLYWQLVGWATHLIISGLLGVFTVYILVLTGREYALWKGLLFGAAVWFLSIAFISPLAGYLPRNASPADFFIVLAYHLLFGALTAWLLVRYAKHALMRKIDST